MHEIMWWEHGGYPNLHFVVKKSGLLDLEKEMTDNTADDVWGRITFLPISYFLLFSPSFFRSSFHCFTLSALVSVAYFSHLYISSFSPRLLCPFYLSSFHVSFIFIVSSAYTFIASFFLPFFLWFVSFCYLVLYLAHSFTPFNFFFLSYFLFHFIAFLFLSLFVSCFHFPF